MIPEYGQRTGASRHCFTSVIDMYSAQKSSVLKLYRHRACLQPFAMTYISYAVAIVDVLGPHASYVIEPQSLVVLGGQYRLTAICRKRGESSTPGSISLVLGYINYDTSCTGSHTLWGRILYTYIPSM